MLLLLVYISIGLKGNLDCNLTLINVQVDSRCSKRERERGDKFAQDLLKTLQGFKEKFFDTKEREREEKV